MDAKRQHMTGSTMNNVVIIKIVYPILQSIGYLVMHLLDVHENSQQARGSLEGSCAGRSLVQMY